MLTALMVRLLQITSSSHVLQQCKWLCINTHAYMHTHTYTHTHMHVHIHAHACTHTHTHFFTLKDVVKFLIGEDDGHALRHRLVQNCDHINDEVRIT